MLQQNRLCSQLLQRLSLASTDTTNDACLEVKARGFWSRRQDAYFDVRVFYPNVYSYRSLSLTSVYKCHEDVKKREYGQQVWNSEDEVFTSYIGLYFYYWHGTWGYCILQMFSWSTCHSLGTGVYNQTINWLRYCLSFVLLCGAILCIRGSRSSAYHPVLGSLHLSVVLAESRLTN